MHGRIIASDNDVFVWTPSTEKDDFFLMPLSNEQKKAQISSQLSAITGRSCRFETSRRSVSSDSLTDDPETKHIDMLYETFGKEPVDIVDKL